MEMQLVQIHWLVDRHEQQIHHQLSPSLTSLLLEKGKMEVAYECEKGYVWGEKSGWTAKSSGNMIDADAGVLTGPPRLAAANVCEANDAFWCSHICFPPWPHVLWVNAGPPRLNTGDPVTNDVLLGLLCIGPQKQIDEHVIVCARTVGARRVCGSLCKCVCFSVYVDLPYFPQSHS